MEKFRVFVKKSAVKQLRNFPIDFQTKIQNAFSDRLSTTPNIADGKHIKKLTEGYRLRVGEYRVFYDIEVRDVVVTSIVRRTSTTY